MFEILNDKNYFLFNLYRKILKVNMSEMAFFINSASTLSGIERFLAKIRNYEP